MTEQVTERVTEKGISEFEKAASQERSGLISECWDFLNQNKKWWLLPIVTVFFIFGIFLSSLFVMTPDSRLMEVCSLTLPGSRRTGFVP